MAFESIHKFVMDLIRFVEDLDEGIFIQQSVDTVLFNADGKQLLAEAIYMYGLMLLITDMKFQVLNLDFSYFSIHKNLLF